jgi:hypothetical protein
MSHDDDGDYERALQEVLDGEDTLDSNAWRDNATNDDAASDASSLRMIPAIAIDDAWNEAQSPSASLSTADYTLSLQDSASFKSVADDRNSPSSPNAASSHRSYLGPLRSKRYDGLRSSLLSPALNNVSRPRIAHSRSSSVVSMLNLQNMVIDQAADDRPRDTLRWTRLKRISDQLYSSAGRKAFGNPTCLAVSGMLAFGTSKGLILIFDYQQNCKHVIGNGSRGRHSAILMKN